MRTEPLRRKAAPWMRRAFGRMCGYALILKMPMNPYMITTEVLLREAKRKLDLLSTTMSAAAPEHSALARKRKLSRIEARYADVSRRFEQLRAAGTEGIADLKVGLEKAFAAAEQEDYRPGESKKESKPPEESKEPKESKRESKKELKKK
jgi:hypothetical protein